MTDTVIMSIKPEYAEKIFNGSKKYEFRRIVFKNKNISKVIVYASFPVMKVIGEFIIGDILEMEIDELWEKTSNDSGISKEFFKSYYRGKNKGYAIKISSVRKYEVPLSIKKEFNIRPPQSFQYIG